MLESYALCSSLASKGATSSKIGCIISDQFNLEPSLSVTANLFNWDCKSIFVVPKTLAAEVMKA